MVSLTVTSLQAAELQMAIRLIKSFNQDMSKLCTQSPAEYKLAATAALATVNAYSSQQNQNCLINLMK